MKLKNSFVRQDSDDDNDLNEPVRSKIMTGYRFQLNDTLLEAQNSGALWVERSQLLCVSDLHLGKSDRLARSRGVLLPPYETMETLSRLADAITLFDPKIVVCLGDSFDDPLAENSLSETERDTLATLQAGREWIWIAGNHDPAPVSVAGQSKIAYSTSGLTFRHEATDNAFEISGHFHPKHKVPSGQLRPAFIHDTTRLIMPAFGLYTGGLPVKAPELQKWFPSGGIAVLCGGSRPLPVPF